MNHDLKEEVYTHLDQARIEDSLDALMAWLRQTGRQQDIHDAQLLKINWINAKQQYELRGTLSRPEYEIVQNKTIFGIQTLLSKPNSYFTTSPNLPRQSRRWLLMVLIFVGVAALGGGIWAVLQSTLEKSDDKQPEIIDTTNTHIPPISPSDTGTVVVVPIKGHPTVKEKQEEQRRLQLANEAEKKKKEEEGLKHLQAANEAFDKGDVLKAQERYKLAKTLVKISLDAQQRLLICDAVMKGGSGTYTMRHLQSGQRAPLGSIRYFEFPIGKAGDNFTNKNPCISVNIDPARRLLSNQILVQAVCN